MTFAPPVSRDNLFYNGDLYIEVANSNRHKRAPISEITTLLRPDLKKANKSPSTDQVGHWYEAQLIHYGLPPSKDKARAKMRLLEALNQKKLVVPERIVKVEAEMKKEYEKAERKAKKDHKASQQVERAKSNSSSKNNETPQLGKKRKESESAAADKTSLPNKKAKIQKPKMATKSTGGKSSKSANERKKAAGLSRSRSSSVDETSHPVTGETIYKRPMQTARSTKLAAISRANPGMFPKPVQRGAFNYSLTPSGPFNMREEDLLHREGVGLEALEEQLGTHIKPAAKQKPKVKQEAKREIASKASAAFAKKVLPGKEKSNIKKEPSVNSEVKPEKKTPIKIEAIAKKETKPKRESTTTPSSQVKSETQADQIPTPRARPLGLINGLYDISCPYIENEWDHEDDLSITLTLADTSVWGAFSLGVFKGILFLPERPWQANPDRVLSFNWRGRPTGEGEIMFDPKDDVGEMRFLGNGIIKGRIQLFGRWSEYRGVRRPEAGTAVRSWRNMKEEWETYNEATYDYECVARWH